jgi:hypothetical protein
MFLANILCAESTTIHVVSRPPCSDLLLEAFPKLGIDRIAPPDGAFYIYADVRRLTDDSLSF